MADVIDQFTEHDGPALLWEGARRIAALPLPPSGSIEYVHYTADYRTTAYQLVDSQSHEFSTQITHCEVRDWLAPDGTRVIEQTQDGHPGPSNGIHPSGSGAPLVEFDEKHPLNGIDTESALAIVYSLATLWISRVVPPWTVSAALSELADRDGVTATLLTHGDQRHLLAITAEGVRREKLMRHELVLDPMAVTPQSETVLEADQIDGQAREWELATSRTWIDVTYVDGLPSS